MSFVALAMALVGELSKGSHSAAGCRCLCLTQCDRLSVSLSHAVQQGIFVSGAPSPSPTPQNKRRKKEGIHTLFACFHDGTLCQTMYVSLSSRECLVCSNSQPLPGLSGSVSRRVIPTPLLFDIWRHGVLACPSMHEKPL